MNEPWTITEGEGPIIATAIHAGHDLRSEVEDLCALPREDRLREEDPHTNEWLDIGDTRFDVHRSRFEVDLNRPRESAVYLDPEDAWGLEIWRNRPDGEVVGRSLGIHDAFYEALRTTCDRVAEGSDRFVVIDLHSYNHRRGGPDAPVDDPLENPEVNVGTGTLDQAAFRDVADAFIDALGSHPFDGGLLDVRENVRFRGGFMSRWINDRYAGRGCALAIEMKKIYMDEWTGEPDESVIAGINDALLAAVAAVREVISN